MNNKQSLRKVMVTTAGVLLAMAGVAAMVGIKAGGDGKVRGDVRNAENSSQMPKQVQRDKPQYDDGLLMQLEKVCKQLDGSNERLAFSGTVYTEDKADSLSEPQEVPFVMCRKGKDMYYKLGTTEIINAGGFYLYADNQAKKVMASEQKDLIRGGGVVDIKKLREALESREYELKSSSAGEFTTITLFNESHITCKEYSVSFNSSTGDVSRYFMRLTNFEDPLRTDNEKIIDMKINSIDQNPEMAKYAGTEERIDVQGTEWKLSGPYAHYELIRL